MSDPQVNPPTEPEITQIDKELFDKTQKELQDYRKKAQELEQVLKDSKINALKEKENWQEVARTYETQAKDYEGKYNGLKDALVREKKYGIIKQSAQKAGLNPHSLSDLDLLDFDEVTCETTSSGRITVLGADQAIENLKRLRPHWFSQPVPSVNPISPETHSPTASVSLVDVDNARKKWDSTRSDADKNAYYEIIRKFKMQN